MKQKQTLTPEARLAAAQLPREAWPYALPAGWQWVRLGDIYDINPKNKAADDTEASFITMSDIEAGMVSVYQTTEKPWGDIKRGHTHFADGDVAFAKISPCLENRKSMILHDLKNGIGAGTTELIVLRSQFVDKYYTFWLVNSEDFIRRCVATYSGTVGQQRVSMDFVKNYPVPLPPLSEQRRLVQRIEGLFARLDAAAAKITAASDAAARRKVAILHAAFTGQLTEQWREEQATQENATDLLRNIVATKQQLIRAKKLKKEPTFPDVTSSECLFEVPSSWCWTRIGQVFSLQAGKNIKGSEIHDQGEFPCYGGNGVRGYVTTCNREGEYPIIGRQGALCGNINFATGKFYATEHAVTVETYGCDAHWAGYFLEIRNLNQFATATAQPGLSVAKVNEVSIPLPPLPEQREIVRRLDALLAREARASAAIERARTELQRLRTAILARAFRGEL